MPFEKGKSGNPSGRPKGAENKTTAAMRQWLFDLVYKNRRQLEQDLRELEPRERWVMLERVLRHVLPQQQAITAEIAGTGIAPDEVAQFRAWQRRNARYENMTIEELQAENNRLDNIIKDL